MHRRTDQIFFFGGGGANSLLPNFKVRENFEDLEPLDCRKRRFQSLNFTFFGTLVQVYCLIPQVFAQLLKICPTFQL